MRGRRAARTRVTGGSGSGLYSGAVSMASRYSRIFVRGASGVLVPAPADRAGVTHPDAEYETAGERVREGPGAGRHREGVPRPNACYPGGYHQPRGSAQQDGGVRERLPARCPLGDPQRPEAEIFHGPGHPDGVGDRQPVEAEAPRADAAETGGGRTGAGEVLMRGHTASVGAGGYRRRYAVGLITSWITR